MDSKGPGCFKNSALGRRTLFTLLNSSDGPWNGPRNHGWKNEVFTETPRPTLRPPVILGLREPRETKRPTESGE